jgi:hypothetical protein
LQVAEKSSPKKRKIEDDQIPLSDWENEDIKSPPPESMVTFTEAPEYTETTDEDMESEDDASQVTILVLKL